MVLVMKLTTFAWNVHDGRQKGEVRGSAVEEGPAGAGLRAPARLLPAEY